MKEKPIIEEYVNAGIYLFSPEAISLVQNTYCDMTDFIKLLSSKNKVIKCFKMDNYWIDIGMVKQYENAINDYKKFF